MQLFGWVPKAVDANAPLESVPSECLLGSAETCMPVSETSARQHLWSDGVLTRLIRDAIRIESDSKTFLSQYYDPKTYSNVMNPMLKPSPVLLWLHLDGSAGAHSARFNEVIDSHSFYLRNGESLSTGIDEKLQIRLVSIFKTRTEACRVAIISVHYHLYVRFDLHFAAYF